jgi:branched-chain amino acid:cation transporter, LIVCS family
MNLGYNFSVMTKKLGIFSLGIAVFAMFFGAGNIVFPLILGRESGSNIPYSLIGFIFTAVFVPILGFISTILYEGNYEKFFLTIGKVPALLAIGLCMILIGPLGASRCVVLSYSAIQGYIPWCSLFVYTLIIAGIIFALTFKENKVVGILGRVLGPVKIILLLSILFLVMITFKKINPSDVLPINSIFSGLKVGYMTLDLIGGIFFAHLIYGAMKDQKNDLKKLVSKGMKAGAVGGIFLGVIYAGFGLVSALHAQDIINVADERLFATLAITILGTAGGVLANVTIAVATLTTAIALTTVFADYLHAELFKKKIPFALALLTIILINIGMENLGFSGIMKVIAPIAVLIYPAFIVLSISNICKKYFGFKYIKSTVFTVLILTAIYQYIF